MSFFYRYAPYVAFRAETALISPLFHLYPKQLSLISFFSLVRHRMIIFKDWFDIERLLLSLANRRCNIHKRLRNRPKQLGDSLPWRSLNATHYCILGLGEYQHKTRTDHWYPVYAHGLYLCIENENWNLSFHWVSCFMIYLFLLQYSVNFAYTIFHLIYFNVYLTKLSVARVYSVEWLND
jgi:hypothetical protein